VLGENNRMLQVFATSGFVVTSSTEAGVVHLSFPTEETERAREAAHTRERIAAAESVRALLHPRSVAVVGASRRAGTIGAALVATFAPHWPPIGNVGMLSQSGALGLAVLDYVRQLNIGMSTFVSVGNKADVSGNDLLSYWADDPRTGVVVLYLESFGNPRKFA